MPPKRRRRESKLAGRKIFIGGIQGSGKTEAAKWLVAHSFRKAIGVRFTPDFDRVPNIDLVRVESGTGLNELLGVCRYCAREGKRYENGGPKPKYDCLVLDEADLLFTSNAQIPDELNELVLLHRHYGLAMIFITRRPQDIPAKIVESCQFQLYFPLEGKNAKLHIGSIDPRVLDELTNCQYGRYDFVFKEIGKRPVYHEALPASNR